MKKKSTKEKTNEEIANELCEKINNMTIKYNRAVKGLRKHAVLFEEFMDEQMNIYDEFEKLGLDISEYKSMFDGAKEVTKFLKELKKIKI